MFDFTSAIHNSIRHISRTMPSFSHIDPDRLAVSCSQTKNSSIYGTYAAVIPMRFKDGSLTTIYRKKIYRVNNFFINGKHILYVVNFYIPRYINLSFERKVQVLFHELYHIGPEFNGDIRRLGGKKYAHGHSAAKYNDFTNQFADEYLGMHGSAENVEFLKHDHQGLIDTYSGVTYQKIRVPKPIPEK